MPTPPSPARPHTARPLTTRRPICPEDRLRYLHATYPSLCPDRERAIRQLFSHATWTGGHLEWRDGPAKAWDDQTEVPAMRARFFATPEWTHGWTSLLSLNPAAPRTWRHPDGGSLDRANQTWQLLALEAAAVHLRCDPAGQAQAELAAVHDLLADHLGRPRWSGPVAPRLRWAAVHTVKSQQKAPPTARQMAVMTDITEALMQDEDFDLDELNARHAALDDTRLPDGEIWTAEEALLTQGPWALLSFLTDAERDGRVRVTGQDAVALGLSMFALKSGVTAAGPQVPLAPVTPDMLKHMYAGVLHHDDRPNRREPRPDGSTRRDRCAVTFTRTPAGVGFTARSDTWSGWTQWQSPHLPLATWAQALTDDQGGT